MVDTCVYIYWSLMNRWLYRVSAQLVCEIQQLTLAWDKDIVCVYLSAQHHLDHLQYSWIACPSQVHKNSVDGNVVASLKTQSCLHNIMCHSLLELDKMFLTSPLYQFFCHSDMKLDVGCEEGKKHLVAFIMQTSVGGREIAQVVDVARCFDDTCVKTIVLRV